MYINSFFTNLYKETVCLYKKQSWGKILNTQRSKAWNCSHYFLPGDPKLQEAKKMELCFKHVIPSRFQTFNLLGLSAVFVCLYHPLRSVNAVRAVNHIFAVWVAGSLQCLMLTLHNYWFFFLLNCSPVKPNTWEFAVTKLSFFSLSFAVKKRKLSFDLFFAIQYLFSFIKPCPFKAKSLLWYSLTLPCTYSMWYTPISF